MRHGLILHRFRRGRGEGQSKPMSTRFGKDCILIQSCPIPGWNTLSFARYAGRTNMSMSSFRARMARPISLTSTGAAAARWHLSIQNGSASWSEAHMIQSDAGARNDRPRTHRRILNRSDNGTMRPCVAAMSPLNKLQSSANGTLAARTSRRFQNRLPRATTSRHSRATRQISSQWSDKPKAAN